MKMKGMLFMISAFLFLASCEEVPPFINFSPDVKNISDTAYIDNTPVTAQNRVVVIEDFTGVRCVNCPDAAAKAKAIQDANPGRVVVMGLHPTTFPTFTTPFPKPDQDFRSAFSQNIMEMVGTPAGLPAGTVNRKIFPPQTARAMTHQNWTAAVDAELLLPTPVNIEITKDYITNTRELKVKVKLTYTSGVSADHYLSVALSESHIMGKQSTTSGIDNNYEHNHVLRTMLTAFNGNPLTASLVKGRVIERNFTFEIPAEWVPENCHINAWVNEGSPSMEIIHAAEKDVK